MKFWKKKALEGVVLGGCPSSGTTLLRAILDSHSKVSCGPELGVFDRSYIYQKPYSEFCTLIQIAGTLAGQTFAVKGNSKRSFNIMAEILNVSGAFVSGTHFSPGANANINYYIDTWPKVVDIALSNDSYVGFFDQLFSVYLDKNRKTIWVEKTPENIYFSEDFLQTFPSYKFIHILRNPLDVISSLVMRGFHPLSLENSIKRYLSAIKQHNKNCKNERYYYLWYEDLIETPKASVTDLMMFLEKNFETKQLAFYKKSRVATAGYAEAKIHSNSVGRWKKDLNDEQLTKILTEFNTDQCKIDGSVPESFAKDEVLVRLLQL